MFGKVQPAVKGGQERRRLPCKERPRIIIEMEVKEVELFIVTFLPYALEHQHVKCVRIPDRPVQP
jgi:hypothetical protein